MNVKGITSPNFEFLKEHDALLVQFAMQAERYCFTDPNTCLIKLRQFAEFLAGQAAAYSQTYLCQGGRGELPVSAISHIKRSAMASSLSNSLISFTLFKTLVLRRYTMATAILYCLYTISGWFIIILRMKFRRVVKALGLKPLEAVRYE